MHRAKQHHYRNMIIIIFLSVFIKLRVVSNIYENSLPAINLAIANELIEKKLSIVLMSY